MIERRDDEPEDDAACRGSRPRENLLQEIGDGSRPYVVAIAKAFWIAFIFRFCLYVFEKLMALLPIEGWEGTSLGWLHAAGMVAGFGIITWIFVDDIYQIQRLRR